MDVACDVIIFPEGGKNSTLSSVSFLHKASQSGHGGSREIVGRASSPNHDSKCGTGFVTGQLQSMIDLERHMQ